MRPWRLNLLRKTLGVVDANLTGELQESSRQTLFCGTGQVIDQAFLVEDAPAHQIGGECHREVRLLTKQAIESRSGHAYERAIGQRRGRRLAARRDHTADA